MSRDTWSFVIWGGWLGLFLVLEFASILCKAVPWWTLSGTSWDAEDDVKVWGFHPVQLMLLAGLALLLAHIVFRWPVVWRNRP